MKTVILICIALVFGCQYPEDINPLISGKMYVQQSGFDLGKYPKLIRRDSVYTIGFSFVNYAFSSDVVENIECIKYVGDTVKIKFENRDSIQVIIWRRIKGTGGRWGYVKSWDRNNQKDKYFTNQTIKCDFRDYDYLLSIHK